MYGSSLKLKTESSLISSAKSEMCVESPQPLFIENSGVLMAALIPWSVAGSAPRAMLGVGADVLPHALLLWLLPVVYLFTKRFYYPEKQKQKT